MTKFQPGDAVFVLGDKENHIRFVSWTHPDGKVSVDFYPENKGERETVNGDDVVYADPVLKFFTYAHLPTEALRKASQPFSRLAHDVVLTTPECEQRSIALQKLLEAKDAAVRARLP